ncbi:hypothetical protein FHR92_000464 [Fontibacillus solani]|uniref:Uncharacterized protein n=1 Tax=Fontibacillus solani TaxID=1572857 RepID=A0A7W3SPS9_9BACL|nr:hypothetical protein [Fontibacillus solani]
MKKKLTYLLMTSSLFVLILSPITIISDNGSINPLYFHGGV